MRKRKLGTALVGFFLVLLGGGTSLGAWGEDLAGGVNGAVGCLARFQTDLVVGGEFSTAGGIPVTNVARWDGFQWVALGDDLVDEGYGPAVTTLVADGDELYAGGDFRVIDGAPADGIARWNGSAWEALPAPAGQALSAECQVNDILVFGGEVYVAGENLHPDGGQCLARHDGSGWTFLSDDFRGLTALAVLDNALYAIGWNPGVRCFARWNELEWDVLTASSSGGGFNDLCAHGGVLYLGGTFQEIEGRPVSFVGRWDGLQWVQAYEGTIAEGFFVQMGMGDPVWINCTVSRLFSCGSDLLVGGVLHESSAGPLYGKAAIGPEGNLGLLGGPLNFDNGPMVIWPAVNAFAMANGSLVLGGDFNLTVPGGGSLGRLIEQALPSSVAGPLPAQPTLHRPFPNPFNPGTTIQYSLVSDGTVQLAIHDLRGGLIKLLVQGSRTSGLQEVWWDGTDSSGRVVPSGTYLLRLETENGVQGRKLTLAK